MFSGLIARTCQTMIFLKQMWNSSGSWPTASWSEPLQFVSGTGVPEPKRWRRKVRLFETPRKCAHAIWRYNTKISRIGTGALIRARPIPPFQGRAIIIVAAIALVIRGGRGGPSQSRPSRHFVFDPPAVLQLGKTRFHFLELRRVQLVLRLRRQQGLNLVLRLGQSIRGLGMRIKCLGEGSGPLLFQRLHLLEKRREGLGVIPGFV